MARKTPPDDRLRSVLAQECAKIIATEGIKDFAKAKRKAVNRLGIATNRALLPSNVEIEQELLAYQRLFHAGEQHDQLRRLRRAALDAMTRLGQFRPRLVGAVLHGTAGRYSDVELHVFANTPEDIIFFLMDQGIEYVTSARRLRLNNGGYGEYPVLQFEFDGVGIDLTVFWQRSEREVPCSPVDGRPMKRASTSEVMALLDQLE